MQVKDVMTLDAVSCHAESTLAVAGQRMLEGRFGVLPVVDQDGKAVGMITDRDIAMAAVTRQRNASDVRVHEAMSRHLQDCHPDDHVSVALGKMGEGCVRRLPVVDADGHLMGIISIEDLAVQAVGDDKGIDQAEFFDTFKRLCQRPVAEPKIELSDTMTPG